MGALRLGAGEETMVSRIVVGCVLALGLALAFTFWGTDETAHDGVEKSASEPSHASEKTTGTTTVRSGGVASSEGSKSVTTPSSESTRSVAAAVGVENDRPTDDGLLKVTDMRRPVAVASAALKALQEGSFEAILTLTPPSRLEGVRKRWGPGTPRYDELFGEDGWQQRTIQSWTGQLLEIRVKRGLQALVKYGEMMDEGVKKHLCVSLLNIEQDGRWYFKNLDARPSEEYSDYGEVVASDYVLPSPDTKP
jgi:hypothetical protein